MKISHSAKNVYIECPFKYFLHYYRKLRPTTLSSPLVYGNSIDLGLNFLLENKDLAGAIKVFELAWNSVDFSNVKFSKADLQEELVEKLSTDIQANSHASLLAKARIQLTEYNAQIMPLLKRVIKVQIDDVMENDLGDKLVVKTDFIAELHDGRIILFDNKTSSVKYEQDSVSKSDQLGTYFEALREEYKIDACGYIVIPKKINKKKLPAVQISVIIDTIPEDIINNTLNQFEEVLVGIKSAQFPKNFDNCVNKFGKCPYYNYCHEGSTEGLKEKEEK